MLLQVLLASTLVRFQALLLSFQNLRAKYSTAGNNPPPTVSSPFIVSDDGNCSPRFMRMTLYSAPTTADLLNSSHIPFGAIIQPLAELGVEEVHSRSTRFLIRFLHQSPVPVVDFGTTGPIRCQRCRAYINPFATFIDGGRQYVCRFCDFGNQGIAYYRLFWHPQCPRITLVP